MRKKSARSKSKTYQRGRSPLVIIVIVGLVIAAIVIFFKLSPQTQPANTYSNFDEELSIQTPKNWQIKENPVPQTLVAFFSPKEGENDRFVENVGLDIIDLSVKPNATLEELVSAWINQSKSEFPDSFEVISQESTKLGDIEAIKVISSAKDEVSPLKSMAFFAIKDGEGYTLNYSAEEKSFDKFLPDVESLVKSLTFGPQEVKWENYKSDEYGYSVSIPSGWKVNNTPSETSREISIVHPQGKALVLITALKDEGLKDTNYMKESMQAFKEKLENDPVIVRLAKFEDKVEGDTGAFIGIGEEQREGANWYFEQRGLLGTSGKVLLFHGAAKSDVYEKYKDIISKIIEGFKIDD